MARKSMSPAEPDVVNDYHLDPIIDALLEHLPAPGDYWSTADRKRWLQIMEMAFELIYAAEATGVPAPTEEPHGGQT